MAISLKRYEPQVGVSAQTGTQAIGGGLASAMIQAAGADAQTLATVAGAAGDVFNVFQKQKETIRKETEEIQSKNEVQKFNVEYTNMQTALKDSLKDVKNEEEANVLINTFTQDVNKLVDSNTYLPQSMQDINYLRIGEDKRFDIEAIAAVGANNTLERINTLELIRAESETGARTEAEFNTATDELVGLSKEYTPAWAVEQKAKFTLKRNFNVTTSTLKTNIPKAEKMFAERTFTPSDSDRLQTSIFIANQRADEQAEREQGRILDSYEKQLEAGDLFPTELEGLDKDVFYINGKEYPNISERELKLLTMSVNSQASAELQDPTKNAKFNLILKKFNEYALKGEKYKDTELDSLLKVTADAKFSPFVYNDILKQISITKKTKMTTDQAETFALINNAFEAFAIEYTGELAIQKHLSLIKAFDRVLDKDMSIDTFKELPNYKDMLQITSTVEAENRINNTNDYNTYFDEIGFD